MDPDPRIRIRVRVSPKSFRKNFNDILKEIGPMPTCSGSVHVFYSLALVKMRYAV
jgi:hypothetical protein